MDGGARPARGRDHLARVVRAGRPGAPSVRRARRGRRARGGALHVPWSGRARAPTRTTTEDFEPATSRRSLPAVRRRDAHAALRRRARAPSTSSALKAPLPRQRGRLHRPRARRRRPDLERPAEPEPYGFTSRSSVRRRGGRCTGEDRRNLYLHRDHDLLPRLPARSSPSDGASSPAVRRPRRRQPQRADLRHSDGFVHAYRPDGSELPGWPVRSDPLPLHTGGRAFASGAVSRRNVGGAILASLAVGDLDRDGVPEVVAADLEGKVYVWNADGTRRLTREANPAYSGKPLKPFVERAQGPAQPHPARLHRLAGARRPRRRRRGLEVVAAAMDRHVYAWKRRRRARVGGLPGARRRPRQGRVDRPRHPRGHLQARRRRRRSTGRDRRHARGRRPRPATASPRSSSARTRSTRRTRRATGGLNADNGAAAVLARAGGRSPPALLDAPATAAPLRARRATAACSHRAGRRRSAQLRRAAAGRRRGHHRLAGDRAASNCPQRRQRAQGRRDPRRRARLHAQPRRRAPATAAAGRQGQRAAPTRGGTRQVRPRRRSRPSGHPAFGDFAGGTSFLVPAAGLIRALDLGRQRVPGRPGLRRGAGTPRPASSGPASRRR